MKKVLKVPYNSPGILELLGIQDEEHVVESQFQSFSKQRASLSKGLIHRGAEPESRNVREGGLDFVR